jgi:hypothetical protein
VAFSPDGERVVTGSFDNTARVWDLSGASPSAIVLEGHRDKVTSVAFSLDGKRVVTGSFDNTARVWDTPPVEELIPLARAALTRCLTIAQRDVLGLPVLPRRRAGPRTSLRHPARRSAAPKSPGVFDYKKRYAISQLLINTL